MIRELFLFCRLNDHERQLFVATSNRHQLIRGFTQWFEFCITFIQSELWRRRLNKNFPKNIWTSWERTTVKCLFWERWENCPPVVKTKVRVRRNLGRVTDSKRFSSNISVNDLDRVERSVLKVSPSRKAVESASHVSLEHYLPFCTPFVIWTMNVEKLNSEGWCDQKLVCL